VWAGFSILRVKMHAWLFECHWNSHNQSFFLNAFILLWAHNWFCVPFVLSHALHPPQMSNCGMGRLEIHLGGLPRPKRNPTHSPSCCTARWPTTAVSNLLCMRMKSMKINVCTLNSKEDVYFWLKHHSWWHCIICSSSTGAVKCIWINFKNLNQWYKFETNFM
jgi:hypothetical protein